MMFSRSKSGFTMAEVLITLGIIGIVAAMTLPTLVGNYNKTVVETRLKSTYSQVADMLQLIDAQNSMAFIPDIQAKSPGWSYDYSFAVFERYFAPNLNIVKKLAPDKRFEICNYKGEGCYKNPSYSCVVLANGVGLCTAVNSISGRISFQVIINPNRSKLYAGKDAFAFSTGDRDISNNKFSLSLKMPLSEYYSESTRSAFINSCISNNPFPAYVGKGVSDREYYCTFLLQYNNWTVPSDYPINF